MIRIIPTLDYEIHGNGHGCARELMVQPTERLMDMFNSYQARITIMADVAEILRFRDYHHENGHDHYHAQAIETQLKKAISEGHDVQLHLHSSYFNAHHVNNHWQQDWSEYDFARLDYSRMNWMIHSCKTYLEQLLQPVNPDYRCIAFRAANWSMHPSEQAIRALLNNGISIDTSVFKYGRRNHPVQFDYTHAHSHFMPWPVSTDDICCRDPNGKLIELPIYSEARSVWDFLSLNRMFRIIQALPHRINIPKQASNPKVAPPSVWRDKMAWKADINQSTGKQLIGIAEKLTAYQNQHLDELVPFVLIGHSKLFNAWNEHTIRPFLEHCLKNQH
ncbi:MAG: hypothetical protein ACR2HF_01530, partial [Methylococcaceae bacterium]